jgi:AcrR family transcriptional regulator
MAGLAASQLRRLRRIVDSAVRLAEKGGFEGVRLRDVAEASDVALGTLYKYFRNKEDILLFALTEQVARIEKNMELAPTAGTSPLERCENFFRSSTLGLTQRPQFARAVLRSMASGDPDITVQIAGFHLRVTRLIIAAMRGERIDAASPVTAGFGTEREHQVAFMLMNVWYSSLAGWAGGLHAPEVVWQHVRTAASLMSVPSTSSLAVERSPTALAEAR